MKLNLLKVVNGCRLGKLTNLGRNKDKSMEFPGCMLYTRTGSAPHLTYDILQTIEDLPLVAQITLSTLAEYQEVLEDYKQGIGKFVGMPDSVFYCSLQDPVTTCPTGFNTNKTVSVWGGGGRLEMTPLKFISIQHALQADWFQCLSDGEVVPGGNSRKRAKKSVDRSLVFLDECLRLQEASLVPKKSVMIGAIEGGEVPEERLRSARETATRPVGGFVLNGFQGDVMDKNNRLKLIAAVTGELPEDKPRLIHGVGKPDEVLECVERGVDLFESCFPYQVTERGCALSFNYNYQLNPETAVLDPSEIPEPEKNGESPDDNEEPDQDRLQMTAFEISLSTKRYQDDFRPLIQGCHCYSCRNHTRAYIHHLLTSNELLAEILLMIHNFQHYFGFFHAIRQALKDSQLPQLKDLINKQSL
ncbi:queuine tRNA-ribosyltransferase accessory subunit 2 [Microcaecilia unicolor]|uniref:Queuine tRNA-ribosyltransferase accessory subunit 2 n=1 Tax=Microcaecilia unicolor TaxID=1415580 RepID=A0A6P7Y760_9AMPH|nr:queuine tRNA-ribosyltransferase accessory subunit 2 [Microcaecilia unicolor]XP_030060812.1 queuine tRNA-ribosyltransferase accessory subunit 2 [Microcaecilia unicolor]XP_030060813.1 queuine tRNA-ribosyltransferase accessory subunit 2 [Microcaecilia unicolor]XP_030060814.1 queuine tRNA-ribosyltransferase accessory subunit 2 [Microcaecilia unicolor]